MGEQVGIAIGDMCVICFVPEARWQWICSGSALNHNSSTFFPFFLLVGFSLGDYVLGNN